MKDLWKAIEDLQYYGEVPGKVCLYSEIPLDLEDGEFDLSLSPKGEDLYAKAKQGIELLRSLLKDMEVINAVICLETLKYWDSFRKSWHITGELRGVWDEDNAWYFYQTVYQNTLQSLVFLWAYDIEVSYDVDMPNKDVESLYLAVIDHKRSKNPETRLKHMRKAKQHFINKVLRDSKSRTFGDVRAFTESLTPSKKNFHILLDYLEGMETWDSSIQAYVLDKIPRSWEDKHCILTKDLPYDTVRWNLVRGWEVNSIEAMKTLFFLGQNQVVLPNMKVLSLSKIRRRSMTHIRFGKTPTKVCEVFPNVKRILFVDHYDFTWERVWINYFELGMRGHVRLGIYRDKGIFSIRESDPLTSKDSHQKVQSKTKWLREGLEGK